MALELVHDNTRKVNCEDIIHGFIEFSSSSKSTRSAYRTDVTQFFKMVKNKEISELVEDDLTITRTEIDLFISILKERKITNKTINRKVIALRGFFNYLYERMGDFGVTASIDIELINSIKRESVVEKNYGNLDRDEVLMMADIIGESDLKMPKLKRMMVLFALQNGFRRQELISLEWKDFMILRDGSYYLEKAGKNGSIFKREVTADFYDELYRYKEDEVYVFPFDNNDIQEIMNYVKEKMGIPENRNIVFHSIRGTAITEFYKLTKDPNLTQDFAQHASFDTTRRYLKKNNGAFKGVLDMREALNSEVLKSLSREELIKLIEENEDAKTVLVAAFNKK